MSASNFHNKNVFSVKVISSEYNVEYIRIWGWNESQSTRTFFL